MLVGNQPDLCQPIRRPPAPHLCWVHAQVDLHQLEGGHLLLQLQLQPRVEQLGPGNGVAPHILLSRVGLRNL